MKTEEILQFITKELGITHQERGRNIFFSCPFHADKTPSLSFSKENNFFKCFSCGFKAKDVFTFWAKVKNVSLGKALERFAELGYIEYIIHNQENEKETNYEKICSLTSDIYQHNLLTKEGSNQLLYLKEKRNLNDEMIEQFSLGTSISNKQVSKLLFENEIFPISDLVESNLFNVVDKGEAFDFFWEKQIIFPIKDEKGKVLFFASRNLNSNKEGKYFFLPGGGLIQKSSLLYNYDKVKECIEDFCYLVEGFFDVISLTKMGFKNSLSALGTSVSTEQIKMLKKLEKKVIIFFDGDQPGVEASVKISALLTLNDIDCEIIEHQKKMDPDELCISGKEEINKAIRRKRSPIHFTIRYYFKEMRIEENPQKTKIFVLKIAEIFSQFRRNIQLFIVKKLSLITGMTIEETREIYFSDSKKKFEIKEINFDDKWNSLEESVIYYSCRDREFWCMVKSNSSCFLLAKNRKLWEIVNNFYLENSAAESFSGFEKNEEFLELPLFDEKEEEKENALKEFNKRVKE